MSLTYIIFRTDASSPKRTETIFQRMVRGVLTTIIPAANPDFDNKIDEVRSWLIEIDNDSGIPEREVGLDGNGRAIVKMSYKKNYGYWTDNNLVLEDFRKHFHVKEITSAEFEETWGSFG